MKRKRKINQLHHSSGNHLTHRGGRFKFLVRREACKLVCSALEDSCWSHLGNVGFASGEKC